MKKNTTRKNQPFSYKSLVDPEFHTLVKTLLSKKKLSSMSKKALFLFMGLPDDLITLPKDSFRYAHIRSEGLKLIDGAASPPFDRMDTSSIENDIGYISYNPNKEIEFHKLLKSLTDNSHFSDYLYKALLFYYSFEEDPFKDLTDFEIVLAYKTKTTIDIAKNLPETIRKDKEKLSESKPPSPTLSGIKSVETNQKDSGYSKSIADFVDEIIE